MNSHFKFLTLLSLTVLLTFGLVYSLVNAIGSSGNTYLKPGASYGLSVGEGSAYIKGGDSSGYGLIVETGNVGIGITSPGYKLDVAGDIGASGSYYYGDSKAMFQYSDTWLRINPGNAFTSGIYASTGIFRTDGILQVGSSGGTLSVGSGGDFAYRTNVLYANTAGKVGIGTTSLVAKLHVADGYPVVMGNDGMLKIKSLTTTYGSETVSLQTSIDGRSDDYTISEYGGDIRHLLVLQPQGGYVGIGTTSPGAKLDIKASGGIPLRITNDTYNNWVIQKRRSDDTQLFGIKESNSNGAMTFVTNNLDRMTINSSGAVGIGNTNPFYQLDVNGWINGSAGYRLRNGYTIGAVHSLLYSVSGGCINSGLMTTGATCGTYACSENAYYDCNWLCNQSSSKSCANPFAGYSLTY